MLIQRRCSALDSPAHRIAKYKTHIELAFHVLLSHHFFAHDCSLNVLSDPDGSELLVASVKFYGTGHDELWMESELALKLADLPDWNPCIFALDLVATSLPDS